MGEKLKVVGADGIEREYELGLPAQPYLAKGKDEYDMFKQEQIAVVPTLRQELKAFAGHMEAKLKKNDHKKGWRELPIEALRKLLDIEIQEYQVAKDYLSVSEQRKELVDLANFCMIVWDRLSMLEKDGK